MDLSFVRSKSKATIAMENIVRCALNCIKTKAAGLHFETELSFLKACHAEIGHIGHSRNNFPDICKAAVVHIFDMDEYQNLSIDIG